MIHKKSTVEDKLNEVNARISEALESGTFKLRWSGFPCNYERQHAPYQGFNALILIAMQSFDPEQYKSRFWITFQQAKKLDKKIVKGSKGVQIFFSKQVEKKELDENGKKQYYWFKDYYTVFNLSQFDDYDESDLNEAPSYSFQEKLEILQNFMTQTDVTFVNQDDNRAYYQQSTHSINMPKLEHFHGDQETKETYYLCTLAHEIVHSSRNTLRPELDRSDDNSEDAEKVRYSKEEVIAELGSALLCSAIGIDKLPIAEHGGYIKGWLNLAVTDDANWLSKASKHAFNAVTHLMKFHDSSWDLSQPIEEKVA